MDIRVTSTGKVFYQCDPLIAALLCEAFPASFERANQGPHASPRGHVQAPGTSAQFGLKESPTTGEWVVMCTDGRTTLYFNGKASELATHDFWMCGKANKCPPELVIAYRAKRQAYGTLQENEI